MFLSMDQSLQFVAVATFVRYGSSGDDLPSVESLVDEMDRDPADLHPIFHCLSDRISPLECREQRGWILMILPFVGIEKHVADYSHVACEAYQIYTLFAEMT